MLLCGHVTRCLQSRGLQDDFGWLCNLKALVVSFLQFSPDPTKATFDENLHTRDTRYHWHIEENTFETYWESRTSLLFSFSSKLAAFCIVIDMASPLFTAVRVRAWQCELGANHL
jgi:hypothetical protein